MSFYEETRALVLGHGAIHNAYLARFQCGALSDREFRAFAVEFYNFARFFPRILAAQLVNTEDEAVADELTRVLYSELGDGIVAHRHELLYRKFLRSVGISVHDALGTPMRPSTRAYIDGMDALYGGGNHAMALGASFGLEHMAIPMWDQLIPGLSALRASRYPAMDLTYFTFHRALEESHEAAMKQAVQIIDGSAGGLSSQEQQAFREGVRAVLDFLYGFWMGLEEERPQADGGALAAAYGDRQTGGPGRV
ncbi:iron-containing redox enzyme family protein [Nitrospirales bacterium NOB]|nr:hypothetical protein [Nitrospirota bacterium]MCE7964479.1 iron-containing redox enzyme family protein [Nitrospira sp. NTP2]MCK6492415.1 iron-containing redox enzyme family protein [Nitrospira sp.]MDL1891234.1 iron-containing redox enzyme family protein [Nitrospirales bacterium NOB]MEB2340060.1 iron-containing redox enzyme family protein [Nitrospirales bacterium]